MTWRITRFALSSLTSVLCIALSQLVIIFGTVYLYSSLPIVIVSVLAVILFVTCCSDLCFCCRSSTTYVPNNTLEEEHVTIEDSKVLFRRVCFLRTVIACVVASIFLLNGDQADETYWGRAPSQLHSLIDTKESFRISIPYFIFATTDCFILLVTFACCR